MMGEENNEQKFLHPNLDHPKRYPHFLGESYAPASIAHFSPNFHCTCALTA